jgi:hypothetical protein
VWEFGTVAFILFFILNTRRYVILKRGEHKTTERIMNFIVRKKRKAKMADFFYRWKEMVSESCGNMKVLICICIYLIYKFLKI